MAHDGNHRGEQAIQLTPEKEVIFNRARLVLVADSNVERSLGGTAAAQNQNAAPVLTDIDARVRYETARLAAEAGKQAEKQHLEDQANQARETIVESYRKAS